MQRTEKTNQSAYRENQPISDEQLYASFSKRESQNEKGFKKAIENMIL